MLPHHPTISVILPVYNGAEYFESAVNSILNQSYCDFELLICDDGSSDGTTQMVRDFEQNDSRIQAIYWPTNRGIPSAQNALIDLARGEYLACMNADDISLPGRLGAQLKQLRKEEKSAVLFGACELIDANGEKLGEYTPPTKDFSFHLRFRNPFVHPLLFTRTQLLRSFKYREIPQAEDYDLFVRMMAAGIRFHVSEQPLLRYRVHETNMNNPEKAFVQMSTAMWIRHLIRTDTTHAQLSELEECRSHFDFQTFREKWPAYTSCFGKGKRPKWSGLFLLANYCRFDALARAEVRNSIRYALARLFR